MKDVNKFGNVCLGGMEDDSNSRNTESAPRKGLIKPWWYDPNYKTPGSELAVRYGENGQAEYDPSFQKAEIGSRKGLIKPWWYDPNYKIPGSELAVQYGEDGQARYNPSFQKAEVVPRKKLIRPFSFGSNFRKPELEKQGEAIPMNVISDSKKLGLETTLSETVGSLSGELYMMNNTANCGIVEGQQDAITYTGQQNVGNSVWGMNTWYPNMPLRYMSEFVPVDNKKNYPGKQAYSNAEVICGAYCLCINVTYPSGETQLEYFPNLMLPVRVAHLVVENPNVKDQRLFLISFGNGIFVIGNQKKANKENLYDWFMGATHAGLQSNKISKAAIKDALYAWFKYSIENTKDKMHISGKAGWENGCWLCAEWNPYTERSAMPELSLMHKYFHQVTVASEDNHMLHEFFKFFTEIKDLTKRVFFLETLASGILSSLLNAEGIRCDCFMNLILENGTQIESFMRLFQVFNRNKMEYLDLTGRMNADEILEDSKDEVLVLGMLQGSSDYMKKQGTEKLNKIVRAVCYENCHCTVVALNCIRSDEEEAVNIYVGPSFITETMKEILNGKAVDEFLQKFVTWVGNNMKKVKYIIRDAAKAKETFWNTVWEILLDFGSAYDINIAEMLDVLVDRTPQELIDALRADSEMEVDADGVFVKIRQGIKEFHVVEKNGTKWDVYEQNACYLDSEGLYIPCEIFGEILECSDEGAVSKVVEAIAQADAFANNKRYRSTIHVANTRVRAYKIKRSVLEGEGKVAIKALGKEENDARQ